MTSSKKTVRKKPMGSGKKTMSRKPMTSSKKPMTSSKKAMTSNKVASGKMAITTSQKGGYAVGYGKPPLHTRFRKGQSGNPSGRAKRAPPPVRRARALALQEAYRTVTVADGAGDIAMPAIQAILRRQIALAMKGNGPAQRAVIAAVAEIEDDEARAAEKPSPGEAQTGSTHAEMSDTEAARRVALLLRLTAEHDPEFRAELAPELRPTLEASWARREVAAPREEGEAHAQ
jgi:hypothetical protein